MGWKVYLNGKFTGIIESNFAYASKYWANRPGCKLREWNDDHLRFPYK